MFFFHQRRQQNIMLNTICAQTQSIGMFYSSLQNKKYSSREAITLMKNAWEGNKQQFLDIWNSLLVWGGGICEGIWGGGEVCEGWGGGLCLWSHSSVKSWTGGGRRFRWPNTIFEHIKFSQGSPAIHGFGRQRGGGRLCCRVSVFFSFFLCKI